MHWYCALKTHLTWNSCDIRSFIGLYLICQHVYSCVKHVFNAWYSCAKCMNLWMDEICKIFIINSLYVKFVMNFFSFQQLIVCIHNNGGGVLKGGSWERTRLIIIAWFNIKDVCVLCLHNWNSLMKKSNQDLKKRSFDPLKLQMPLAQLCKNTWSTYLCRHPNISITKERNWLMGCQLW
jgi:hypothetical protein